MSLDDLEILLLEKRYRLTEQKVRRFVAAQQTLDRAHDGIESGDERPQAALRPPDTWRGAGGGERLFRPLALQPLVGADHAGKGGRSWRSRLLLVAEALILVGLIYVAVRSYGSLRELNQEARALQQTSVAAVPTRAATEPPAYTPDEPSATATSTWRAPTPSPTALSAALAETVALTPTTPQVASSAAAEVQPTATQHARAAGDQPQSAPEQSVPSEEPTVEPTQRVDTTPPAPGAGLRLEVPSLDIDAPIVEGDDWETLKEGIGHRTGSANPGQIGNMILSAHNDVYGEIFRHLNDVEPGDVVYVHTLDDTFVYGITSVDIVLPSRVEVMDPTDYPSLTLITCYPYLLDTHRVVAKATLSDTIAISP